jgi:hypothetical protein
LDNCELLRFINGSYTVTADGPAIGLQTNQIIVESGDFNLVGEVGFGEADLISLPVQNANVTFDFNATAAEGLVFSAKTLDFNYPQLIGITNATRFVNDDFENTFDPLFYPKVFVQFRGNSLKQELNNTDGVHVQSVDLTPLIPPVTLTLVPSGRVPPVSYQFSAKGFFIATGVGNVRFQVNEDYVLVHDDGEVAFNVDLGEALFSSASVVIPRTRTPSVTSAAATEPVSVTASETAIEPTVSESPDNLLGAGAIVGIAVGGAAVIVIVIIIIVCVVKKKGAGAGDKTVSQKALVEDGVPSI